MRNRFHVASDALILLVGTVIGYVARFEGPQGLKVFLAAAPAILGLLALRLVVIWRSGAYGVLWRHGGASDFIRIGAAGAIAGGLELIIGGIVAPSLGLLNARLPLSILVLDWLVTILGPTGSRVIERLRYLSAREKSSGGRSERRLGRPTLVLGAGEAGRSVANALQRSPSSGLIPLGFLDDDIAKRGARIAGLPVLGRTEDLERVSGRLGVRDIVLAMPQLHGEVIQRISKRALDAGLSIRTVPSIAEVVSGSAPITALRPLRIEDLLRREPVVTDLTAVESIIRGKSILVTGAGGSIGQELCRQIATSQPAMLVLLGHGENSIFEVERELALRSPELKTRAVIVDIRDRTRLNRLFRELTPDVVFHAAAHKHVPLMEDNVSEGISNNITGTMVVAQAAIMVGVERFVLISTDKAVRPTSVMGATKRVAELVLQELSTSSRINFSVVRFGNVLGSRGSAVPIFLRQIAAGGPVTVTHPDVRRYFMSIPESVQLVLQAAALGRGGEVFALDMGEPVRIVDLAEHLIRLSGLEPGRDISLSFTGLRPGEKLFEEVFFAGDDVSPTAHPQIRRTAAAGVNLPVLRMACELQSAVERTVPDHELIEMLRRIVPEYHTSATVFSA